jgi:hypothetical protein
MSTSGTYSEGYLENTSWPYDSVAYQGMKAWGSRGSLCQGHDMEAFMQKSRVFIGSLSECPSC